MLGEFTKSMMDILAFLYEEEYTTQKSISLNTDISIGLINKDLKNLLEHGFINESYQLTQKSYDFFEMHKPQRAIILAAGYGIRMIPLNNDFPKGLIKVNGEVLINRLIEQLQAKGINDITVVVGFMKEKYEYLIDMYGVKLVVNPNYAAKNNLYSLSLVSNLIDKTYILPCDVWFAQNPFRDIELYTWYAIKHSTCYVSTIRNNRKNILKKVKNNGNTMIGLAYISQEDSPTIINILKKMNTCKDYDNSFWEEALFYKEKITSYSRVFNDTDVYEINTFEDLRAIDDHPKQLENQAINLIKEKMHVGLEDISHIHTLKKGMTNRSFTFRVDGQTYIMRIPGEGTNQLINRREEAQVYSIIANRHIADDIIYIDAQTGYKITKFIKNSRVCNAENPDDLRKCMAFLKQFHNMNLKVDHYFDIFKKIEYYESLWQGSPSAYPDYKETKEKILSLRPFIEKYESPYSLTHIDAVPDNFLIAHENGQESIRLIDWEYSAMQDCHVDIAMFCIYALYNHDQIDQLIDIYFDGSCNPAIRAKIYAYIACCGLLWSNWCEYKSHIGVEFGEYSLRQYRYAKDYYRLVKEMITLYSL
jgi:CTP:phosphocholine cytidylyltransferase-like protein/thiamine kinase-like enzyme